MSCVSEHSDVEGQSVGSLLYTNWTSNMSRNSDASAITASLSDTGCTGVVLTYADNDSSSSGLLMVLWDPAVVMGTCGVVGVPMVVAGCVCSVWEVVGRRACAGPVGGVLSTLCCFPPALQRSPPVAGSPARRSCLPVERCPEHSVCWGYS